jgi:thiamine-phosphate pyrophosphorylase
MESIFQSCQVPLIGIGGINERNLGEVIRAGGGGVAVISSILGAADPEGAARRLKAAMLDAWAGDPAISNRGAGGGSRAG